MNDYIPGIVALNSINLNGWSVLGVYREPDYLCTLATATKAIPGYKIFSANVPERVVTGVTLNTDHCVIHTLPFAAPSVYSPTGTSKGTLSITWLTSTTMQSIVTKVIPAVGDIIDHLLPATTYIITGVDPTEGLLQTLTVAVWQG